MSAHRFFLEDALPEGAVGSGPAGDDAALPRDDALVQSVALPLSPEDVHHAVSVLRIAAGERIEVVEPGGAVWLAHVTETSSAGISARVFERLETSAHEPEVVLVQGVAKGDKMDDIVRHAVEIGATEIVPFLGDRSVVQLDERKAAARAERWRRIAKSAAEQAHRTRVPQVHEVTGPEGAAAAVADCDRVVVLWEDASAASPGIAQVLEPVRPVGDRVAGDRPAPDRASRARIALVVGPEGGLTQREVDLFARDGAVTATLGANVLRTETAALTALALAVHELGGLGNSR